MSQIQKNNIGELLGLFHIMMLVLVDCLTQVVVLSWCKMMFLFYKDRLQLICIRFSIYSGDRVIIVCTVT